MHVGEELFRTIRMSELEYANLAAAFQELIEENQVEVVTYPIVDRFLAALGFAAGHHDAGEVVRDIQIDVEEE